LTQIEQEISRAIPNWDSIAASERWSRWINACNPATGQVRFPDFRDAIERGDAGYVIATLQRFLQEWRENWPIREVGQGREMRPRAAVYSRADIRQLYELHRRGELVGPEWEKTEADVIRASAEGRISGGLPLTKNIYDMR
jgi:hypothetical protein